MSAWQAKRWGVVRVAALAAVVPERLRLSASATAALLLHRRRRHLKRLAKLVVCHLERAIADPDIGRRARHALLRAKRDAFNTRPAAQRIAANAASPTLQRVAASLIRAEHGVETAARVLRDTFESESRVARSRIEELLTEAAILDGLPLVHAGLAEFATHAVSRAHANEPRKGRDVARQHRQLHRVAAIAARAATRATPFATFAWAGLLDWQRESVPEPQCRTAAIRRRASIGGTTCECDDVAHQLAGDGVAELRTREHDQPAIAVLTNELECFERASGAARARHARQLREQLGIPPNRACALREDALLDAIDGPAPPHPPEHMMSLLEPALNLARASLTAMPHVILCRAFIERHGIDGICDDVGGFLATLCERPGFTAEVALAQPPPPWLGTPLQHAADKCDTFEVQCDPAWCAELGSATTDCDLAVFCSIAKNLIVFDDVQAGRGKYLSRYLRTHDLYDRIPLEELRVDLYEDDQLPVEIVADLGLDFQRHAPLSSHAFELGQAPVPDVERLPLADLVLSFDRRKRRLILHSRRLGREIEPLHLGFLRDLALPAPLLLLRALSIRIRDDTASERVAVHDRLDALCISEGREPPPFRPRLRFGSLVLQRARWRFDSAIIPSRLRGESAYERFERLLGWARSRQLPPRCTIRLADDPGGSPRRYLDWASIHVETVLERVLNDAADHAPIILEEFLPAFDDHVLQVDGRPHRAQWLLQVAYRNESWV